MMFLFRRLMLAVVIVSLTGMGGFVWAQTGGGSDTPGNVLSIDGLNDSGVFINDDPDIDPNPAGDYSLTIEFWINPASNLGTNVGKFVVTKQAQGSSTGITIANFSSATTKNLIGVYVNKALPSSITSPTIPFNASITFTPNVWQHIAVVYIHRSASTETVTLYKNGLLVNSVNSELGNASNDAQLVIGDGISGTTSQTSLQCQIDEFRVWAGDNTDKGVRSQMEIQRNMTLAADATTDLGDNGTDVLGARFSFNSAISAGGTDDTGKVTISSIIPPGDPTISPSVPAYIGDTVFVKSPFSSPISFHATGPDGPVDTDLDLTNVLILSGSTQQLTVARIPRPHPDQTTENLGNLNVSDTQFWLVSHEGSSGNISAQTDAVALTANILLDLATADVGRVDEIGVSIPQTLLLLVRNNEPGQANEWGQEPVTNTSTDINNVLFLSVEIFGSTSDASNLINLYAMGGNADNPLPVQLASFTATADEGKVTLRWVTASEFQNLGFNVYRSRTPDGNFTKLNGQLIPGLGTSGLGRAYQWVDDTATDGDVYYYLEDVSLNGQTDQSDVFPVTPKGQPTILLAPKATRLFQNYPNAFNPETWIPFQLDKAADVFIQIYDIQGRLIRTLTLGQKPAGYYLDRQGAAYWDGRNQLGERVVSGTYLYRFQAGDFVSLKKMVLLK